MIVFITGATAGFGAATARRFVKEGHKVIVSGRRQERVDAIVKELGKSAYGGVLDVRSNAAVQAFVANLPKEFAAVDALVNNAGLALGLEPAQSANMSDWDEMVDTNVKGLMYCTRAILPGMVERKKGHVINLGSVAGTYPYPGGNAYGGTKAFVHQFSVNLRADLVNHHVRVTSLEPGLAETEFSLVRFKGDAEKAKGPYKGLRPLDGNDIAECIYWVATLPAHVNINVMEVMPVSQAFSPFTFNRQG
ncbi:MAG: SDR family NAD(P)-dependent oxidoreductase [Alphaproteobacteria bacterium]